MILDGNSRVGNAKVYATRKEMYQEEEIILLKKKLSQARVWIQEEVDMGMAVEPEEIERELDMRNWLVETEKL